MEPLKHWHAVPLDTLTHSLRATPETGLTAQDAAQRLNEEGPNRLPEAPPPSLLSRIWAQLSDISLLTLLGAALVSAATAYFMDEPGTFLERFGDPIAIAAIVLLNILLSLGQESRATRALAALKEMTAPAARVRRDGKEQQVPSAELVPGDIVLLGEGDSIPADLRLLASFDLSVAEAALTGESAPVEKQARAALAQETPLAERVNACYLGTNVLRGKAVGLVVATGSKTELGHIAGMLAAVQTPETPLQRNLQAFGKVVVALCLGACVVVFALGALLDVAPLHTLFLVAVSLAVAAIPEGLPAVTTIALALGTQRMARRKALVRRLPAVETLGSVQVICTDKTGTLTTNVMTARRLFAAGREWSVSLDTRGGFDPSHAPPSQTLNAAATTRGASLVISDEGEHSVLGDPTDAALLLLAHKGGVRADTFPVLGERPFSSERRMSTTLVEVDGQRAAYNRGAFEQVLERSAHILGPGGVVPLTEDERAALAERQARWAKDGMRVIALASREDPAEDAHWEENLTFLGMVGIVDPPRAEVISAIKEAHSAGIRVVMITGDHPDTARAIARELGMWQSGDVVCTGAALDALSDEELAKTLPRLRVVARAAPVHKLRVIETFARQGVTAAMTGDGVNDAPAIKAAPIGIAMGRAGTDVTKEAADLVLADDNFATIIAAVEEGRAIYANIRKFIFFLLSSNAGLVLAITAAALLGWPILLTPIQLLWINLVTNGLPALALGVDPADPTQMTRPPRPPDAPFLNRQEYLHIALIGVMFMLLGLVAFVIGVVDHELALGRGVSFWDTAARSLGRLAAMPADSIASGQALAFTVLALGPIFHSFNCRSESRSLFGMRLFENPSLWFAALAAVLLQAAALYAPFLQPLFKAPSPSGNEFLFVALLCAAPIVVVELGKVWMRRHFDPTHSGTGRS